MHFPEPVSYCLKRYVMKLYVDFFNFDERIELLLRESIPCATSLHGWHWNEWTGRQEQLERPDISLVYANKLNWREASLKSNLASGKWVVLVGANAPQIGLPIVDTFFKWADLNKFIGLKTPYRKVSQPDSFPPRFALTMP